MLSVLYPCAYGIWNSVVFWPVSLNNLAWQPVAPCRMLPSVWDFKAGLPSIQLHCGSEPFLAFGQLFRKAVLLFFTEIITDLVWGNTSPASVVRCSILVPEAREPKSPELWSGCFTLLGAPLGTAWPCRHSSHLTAPAVAELHPKGLVSGQSDSPFCRGCSVKPLGFVVCPCSEVRPPSPVEEEERVR